MPLLINLIGFIVGIALYALLLFMVARHPIRAVSTNTKTAEMWTVDSLLLVAAVLGLLWNVGGLVEIVYRGFLSAAPSPFLMAASYGALGFLPAVVVHSVWHGGGSESNTKIKILAGFAYFLSGVAAVWHFENAFFFNHAPSIQALQILTFGYLAVLLALFLFTQRQTIERKAVWAMALAVFAVSALHLSQPHVTESFWAVELIGHQASLPLALAILYQDFRFAFADLFLKRALSLLLLGLTCAGLYQLVAGSFLEVPEPIVLTRPQTICVIVGLMMTAAFLYPLLHRCGDWLVDRIILRRANYEKLRSRIMQTITTLEPVTAVLKEVSEQLTKALTAEVTAVQEFYDSQMAPSILVSLIAKEAEILIPTVDQPYYKLLLRNFAGGRRLLSDEIEMLEDIAWQTARRIDVLRVTHERCEQEIREQEYSKLATEAELRALRAQINPHFLFNALTTIGYLINTAPDKALDTLMQLTLLLRGALRSSAEFLTIGDELKLIESYLEIERARFEERLSIEIEAAPELLHIRIPSLILQPLVENAVKHGISPLKNGGTIKITAESDGQNLSLKVVDTGAGALMNELEQKRSVRVGLNNVEQRLHLYFNGAAQFLIESRAGAGTTVEIKIRLSELKSNISKPVPKRGKIKNLIKDEQF